MVTISQRAWQSEMPKGRVPGMRILMISGGRGKAETGVAGVVNSVASELRGLGHTVNSMTMGDLLPNPSWPNRVRTVEYAKRIAQYVRGVRSNFDVVNIHAPFGFIYGLNRRLRKELAGPPYVMTMHGLEERRIYAMGREAKKGRADYFGWKNRIWQRVYHMPTYRWSFETADQCIVLNRESKQFLEDYYHLPGDRVWYVANGVGPEFFQQHHFAEDIAPKLLFVGTWIDHKGIYYLPQAFESVRSVMPGAHLTVAGCMVSEDVVRGSFPDSTQSALTVLPFVERQDMPRLYVQNDIFVFPSLVEGMPLVLLEAMASGMPVVTTESCGMVDLVSDFEDGLLVPPANVQDLVEAILRLGRDRELRQRLGDAAREKMKRYTWTHAARRHEFVFCRALGIRPPDSSLPT